jgi:cytidine deaminase
VSLWRRPLVTTDDELLDLARGARANAYAPYSRFRVGAAVATDDGRVFVGANIENAAYPATVCAERVAVPQAVMAGAHPVTIAVVGDGPGPCTPCGVCRQFMREFAPDLRVLAAGDDGSVRVYVLGTDLLPDGFGPQRLKA